MTAPETGDPVVPRNPLRLLAGRYPWVSAAYLLSYLVVGTGLFAVSVTAVATAGALSLTLAGLPLLIGAAVLVRGCADVERGRVLMLLPDGVPSPYREVTATGVPARLRERWADPATRRDLACVVGLYLPFVVLDTAVLTLWLSLVGLVLSPLWFWAVPQTFDDGSPAHGLALGWFPHGPHGPGAYGVFVGDLPTALATAAVALILLLAANRLLVATALAQARSVRALLRPYVDPMAPARQVLAGPGPLPPLADPPG